MKFDVIIGNPPYQLSDGGGMGTSAVPLYNKFVEQAKKLKPRFLTMIIPSRWFAGGKGLDSFRDEMLTDKSVRVLVDFFNAEDCFPGVDLSGGVCYFLWDKDNQGDCAVYNINAGKETFMLRPLLEKNTQTFIRFNNAVGICRKIQQKSRKSFQDIVSARKPFGLDSKVKISKVKDSLCDIHIYAYPQQGYISRDKILQGTKILQEYKVFVSKAYGERGEFPYLVLGKPFIGEPFSCCSETYLVISGCQSKYEAQNIITYITTKFFRFLVLLKKNTQNAARGVYEFVPMQDFSKPWTDTELYKKYGLTDEEIAFIESMIRPMELGGEDNGN